MFQSPRTVNSFCLNGIGNSRSGNAAAKKPDSLPPLTQLTVGVAEIQTLSTAKPERFRTVPKLVRANAPCEVRAFMAEFPGNAALRRVNSLGRMVQLAAPRREVLGLADALIAAKEKGLVLDNRAAKGEAERVADKFVAT